LHMPPLRRPFFSYNREWELIWLRICWLVIIVFALILFLAWPQTRSLAFIVYLHQWSKSIPVEYFFRVLTFLGDDEFFIIFLSILFWCVNKNLGFWTTALLLIMGVYGGIIKDLTFLERPDLAGVSQPVSAAFPSGHTLAAVIFWGYLAVRIKKTWFWIVALLIVFGIGLSRLVLGYHFLGDVLGGVALGLPLLLLFAWLSVYFLERGRADTCPWPLLLIIAVAVPVLLAAVLPGVSSPKLLGCLAGASAGYILEKEKVRFVTAASLPLQFVKILIGLALPCSLVVGLGRIFPHSISNLASSTKAAGFTGYFLVGIWGTLLAPAIFMALKLAPRESSNLN
jgi:membrane-associated phospholipid phosphatase